MAAGTCAAAAMTPFLFAPLASGLGGLVLGLMAAAKLGITGRILGISGLVRGLVQGSWEAWRVASVVGLLAGGALLHYALPGAFEAFPAAYTLPRATVAGLLVGLGTSRGSGCTSGHGICGNSRLSLRSFAATCTFMASGAVAAHLAGTAAVFGLPQGLAPLAPALPLSPTARFGVALLATATAIAGVLALTGRRLVARTRSATMLEAEQQEASAVEKAPLAGTPPPARADAQKLAALSTATDLLTSLGFALALGVSSMLKPSKVAGFLSVLSGSWDPSLMCVMGGALLVSLPAFQWLLSRRAAPLANICFELPTKTAVDRNLLLGSALFGAGWGIGGMCPGPALVALSSLQTPVLVFVAAMLLGQRLDQSVEEIACAVRKGVA